MSPFLEPDDVEKLTGYVMASKQLKWCRNNGVRAYLNARGEVVVPRSAIDGTKAANEPTWTPNYQALRE